MGDPTSTPRARRRRSSRCADREASSYPPSCHGGDRWPVRAAPGPTSPAASCPAAATAGSRPIAGLNVAHDVLELPSRVHETLGFSPALLERYARHHATGAPLGDADIGALGRSERIDAAARSVRGVLCARLDQAWHRLAPGEAVDDVDAFEDAVIARHGLGVPGLDFTNRSTCFVHVFGGHYDGTHYAYLWSDVLDAAVLEWLAEEVGPTRAAGERLRDALLARGAVADPLAAVRELTGREPSVEPRLRRRGLA